MALKWGDTVYNDSSDRGNFFPLLPGGSGKTLTINTAYQDVTCASTPKAGVFPLVGASSILVYLDYDINATTGNDLKLLINFPGTTTYDYQICSKTYSDGDGLNTPMLESIPDGADFKSVVEFNLPKGCIAGKLQMKSTANADGVINKCCVVVNL